MFVCLYYIFVIFVFLIFNYLKFKTKKRKVMAETELKKQVRPMFEKNWQEHYKIKTLTDLGYERKICKKCGRPFWTNSNREYCADSSCQSREFIGKKTKGYTYEETWKEIEKFFVKNGHESVKRYPVIPRWRNDLYFTNASIIDFQPYVVNGEVKPPADPLIIPQTSIRFGDISNVGVTGTHYTCFVMFGQHGFNTNPNKSYWKDQALSLDIEYLTKVIGVKQEDLVFFEDVWEGGGYFGPSMEYFANGIELGNCVFMQFQDLGNGKYEQLKKPVIDMGAGFERLAWYTNGTPTSYDITFAELLDYLKKYTGIKFDTKLLSEFYKFAGELNVDEVKDINQKYEMISKKLGYSKDELFKILNPIQAMYAICDHTKTLLYTSTDGMLPSNSGGGYNLRILARRIFDLNELYNFNLDFNKIFELHVSSLKHFDPSLKDGLQTACDVLDEEKKKYIQTKKVIENKLVSILSSEKQITSDDFLKLYRSDGITKEQIETVASKLNKKIEFPDDYYGKIAEGNQTGKSTKDLSLLEKLLEKEDIELIKNLPNTLKLYYNNQTECISNVLYASERIIILDKTVFYPEGGGQTFDVGTINDVFNVIGVYNYNGKIIHVLEQPQNRLKKGQEVNCKVNEVRQKQLRCMHTATHLLNAAAKKILGQHIWQAGAHKDVLESHLDVTHYKTITKQELDAIEQQVNVWIFQGSKVNIFELPKDEAEKKYGFRLYQGGAIPGNILRIIEIPNIDVQACAGLHLSEIKDIGVFKIIKRTSVQDGIERIFFTTYLSALQYIKEQENILDETSKIFSVAKQELPNVASNFLKEWKEQRKTIEELREKLAVYEISDILNQKQDIVIKRTSLDLQDIIVVFKKISHEKDLQTRSIALYNDSGDLVIWVGDKSKLNISELIKAIEQKEKKKIKGGNKGNLFQGKLL